MNKILLSSALAVLLLTGCSEEKKPTSEVTTKVETVKNEVVKATDTTKEVVSNAADEAKKMLNTEVEKNTDKVEEAIAEPVAVVEGLDAEALYKSCAACHGLKGEKQALGKSEVIAGWAKEKTIQAMNGYKDGSYGGVMKNIMKGQVTTKTDLEIEALAVFISKM